MEFTHYEKSEFNMSKASIKISYNDFLLLYDVFNRCQESYDKFNQFYIEYLSSKKRSRRSTVIRAKTVDTVDGIIEEAKDEGPSRSESMV